MKAMKRSIYVLSCIVILCLTNSFAQDVKMGDDVMRKMHQEIKDDPYIPNAFQNKVTSPGYYYKSSSRSKSLTTNIFTIQVNIDASGRNIVGDAANEPSIAVNPLNNNEIVIGWRQFDNVESNFRQAGNAFSHDGGQSWTNPGVIDGGIFRSDPVLACDANGNFYYNSLTNDPDYFCRVFKSDNGGSDWDRGTEAKGGDKQWMTIDLTEGEGQGNIYSFWTPYFSTCQPGFFTRSTDGNESYDDCVEVRGFPRWGTMAVGNDGEVYIVGAISQGVSKETQNLVVAKSLNANTKDSVVQWEDPTYVNLDGNLSGWTRINPQGLLGQADIDIDKSDGQGRGNLYVLASVPRTSNSDPADVMFVKSTDGGETWTNPIKINDDESVSNFQWFGTMSVAPNGRIDVIWLDTRDSHVESDSSSLYYSFSTDQGETWSVNERLSELFDPHIGYPNQNKMGDYLDMVSDNKGAHLAWANTFNGEQDVYYSYIIPPVTVGINEISEFESISRFPNTTTGTLVVDGLSSNSRINIYNIAGKVVASISSSAPIEEMDISKQPKGLYFVKISDQSGRLVVKKLIKE